MSTTASAARLGKQALEAADVAEGARNTNIVCIVKPRLLLGPKEETPNLPALIRNVSLTPVLLNRNEKTGSKKKKKKKESKKQKHQNSQLVLSVSLRIRVRML